MKRILVSPQCSSYGVILPNLALARAIREAGHTVYFYAPGWASKLARQAGCIPVEMPIGNAMNRFTRSRPGGEGEQVMLRVAAAVAPHLLKVLAKKRIDGIITDGFAHLGAAIAARKSGLPWASFATNPWMLAPHVFNAKGAPRIAHQLRKKHGLPESDDNLFRQATSPYLHLLAWTKHFDVVPPIEQAVHLGPVNWNAPETERPSWLDELDYSRPLVLVSAISIPMRRFAEMERRFWTATVEALNGLPVQALITLSGLFSELPSGTRPGPHLRVERFVPHSFFFPLASAMVTHAGWGAVTRALTEGVPMVMIPFGWDQPWNAKMCERNQLGFALDPPTLTARKVANRLQKILDSKSPVRAAANAISKQLRRLRPAEHAASLMMKLVG